jgi:hypothetical protein
MKTFVEELKQYFEVTPREKVLTDWAKTEEFDNVGPTVETFMKHTYHCVVQMEDPEVLQYNFNNTINPEFSSGLFLTNKLHTNAKSCFFYC